jgi:16S rRNA (uracil1498-N3)-methyltransferase
VRLTRVHCDARLATGRELELPETAAQHVARVLRLRVGHAIELFDGSGDDYAAEIVAIVQGRVTVRVGERRPGIPASPLSLTLVQGVSRGERMDLTLQKATELGVQGIVPVLTARSVVRLDSEQAGRKLRHWRGIIASACEQSGRSLVPEVGEPRTLDAYLAIPSTSTRLLLDPSATHPLGGLPAPDAAVDLLIGPEGGLEESEIDAAVAAGFTPVRIGPRILRTETASLAAIAILQSRWGDLG